MCQDRCRCGDYACFKPDLAGNHTLNAASSHKSGRSPNQCAKPGLIGCMMYKKHIQLICTTLCELLTDYQATAKNAYAGSGSDHVLFDRKAALIYRLSLNL